jgi:putative copper export protein
VINFSLDTVRTSLHILAVTVWLGGQIVMLGLLPTLRAIGGDAPKQVAAAFGRVAWPFFGLAVVTGIWNMFSVNMAEVSTAYNAVFGIKILLVVVTGGAAWLHQTTDKPAMRGITGGLGFVAALVALVLGVLMAH